MDAVKRREVQAELTSQGYSISYLNSWPAKVDLYRHKPGLSTEGVVCFPVGTLILNQPGNPDHAARKSRLGWLPWPPTPQCKCRACRERTVADWAALNSEEGGAAVVEAEQIVGSASTTASAPFSQKCELCDFVAKSTARLGMLQRLKGHVNHEHAKEAVPA